MDKLYVIVRDDLSMSQKAVQSGHALAAWLLENPNNTWMNQTLVYLKVPDKDHLNDLRIWLSYYNYEYTGFSEPDIGNQLTAIASLGSNKRFSKLALQ